MGKGATERITSDGGMHVLEGGNGAFYEHYGQL